MSRRRVCPGFVRGALVGSAIVAAIALPRAAIADELAWRAPAGCPGRAEVGARVEQRLGVSLDEITAGGIAIEVVARDGGFAATLDVAGVRERELVGATCDELADAVAVIVARVERERGVRRSARVVAVAAPPPPPLEQPDQPVAARHGPRRWQIGARAATLAGICVVPGVGFGGEVTALARVGLATLEIGAARWLTSSAQVEHQAIDRVDVDLAVATARIGARLPNVPLRGWLVGELGSMSGTGVEMDTRRSGSGRWVAGGVGFGTAWNLGRGVAVVIAAEAIDAAQRPAFVLVDGSILYESPRISARTWLGVEVAW